MHSSDRRFPKSHSLVTLGVLVFAGIVITTVARAEPPALRYLGSAALADPSAAPSRHFWLLSPAIEGRLEVGSYQMRFLDTANGDEAETLRPVQLRLTVGGTDRPPRFQPSALDRALMSDTEREQQRLGDSLFSMTLSRSW